MTIETTPQPVHPEKANNIDAYDRGHRTTQDRHTRGTDYLGKGMLHMRRKVIFGERPYDMRGPKALDSIAHKEGLNDIGAHDTTDLFPSDDDFFDDFGDRYTTSTQPIEAIDYENIDDIDEEVFETPYFRDLADEIQTSLAQARTAVANSYDVTQDPEALDNNYTDYIPAISIHTIPR